MPDDTPSTRAVLLRGIVLLNVPGVLVWASGRGVLLALGSVTTALSTSALLVVAASLVVWLDARRRNEILLLANLGFPGWSISVVGGLVAALLEGSAQAVTRMP